MSIDSAHKSSWEIAEAVFGIPFLSSIAIQYIVPFSLSQGILRQVLTLVGIVLIVLGTGLVVLARRELAAFNQPTGPGHPTSRLIKTGVFAVSRNPLYLASVSLFLGLALALNLLWAVATLLLSIIICHYVLIAPEEHYLDAKFGADYQEYTATVHRWLGRK